MAFDDKAALHARVERELSLQPVQSDMVPVFEELRAAAKAFGHLVVDVCPASREQSLALTEIDSALRWAIAAVIRS